ncbi:SNARE associated Golgi protein [Roseivivax jejudonensis]|uniref:SNARE associated Golgi protein n=1 Tax=Roseivivax jejudonensis TaxID=1529041 RepID=A0A1X7AA11_9RHOB|nr:SNARE associated Golgi protein [Roseivivax jejudonensis]
MLAHKGVFPATAAILAVVAGGWTTDLVTYYGARGFREHPRVLKALSHPFAQRLTRRFVGRPLLLTAIFRFIPGARFVAPVLIATATPIRSATYIPVTLMAAVVWGTLMVTIGDKIGGIVSDVWGYVWSPRLPALVAIAALLFYCLKVMWRYWRAPDRP